MFMDCHSTCAERDEHTMGPGCIGHVVRYVVNDGRPDQLDVQVAMATSFIRRDTNEARHRLGLPPKDYGQVTIPYVGQDDA